MSRGMGFVAVPQTTTTTRQTIASQPVSAVLNSTGTTLCKIWDDICLPDNKIVRDLAAQMDMIVKAYCRGDTRLIGNWVKVAGALSEAVVAAGGKPLPAEFTMAPVSVAKGVTERGTPIPPPAVIVTVSDPATGTSGEKEVAVLTDGTQVQPDANMPTTEATPAPGDDVKVTVTASKSNWGFIALAAVGAFLVLRR